MGRIRLLDTSLVLAWITAAGGAAAALILLGYVGYLMILVWGAAAAPLYIVTRRRLEASRRPLDVGCRRLALRSYIVLAIATTLVHLVLLSGALGALGESDALGVVTGAGFMILFVGQVGYVAAVSWWLIAALTRRQFLDAPSRPAV